MEKVVEFINKNELLKDVKKVGVAVSGGADSLALLHFLNSKKEYYNIEVVALHFDHKIRKTSHKDREFVQSFCEKHNIQFHYCEADVLKYCAEQKRGVEEGARELRYNFFESCIKAKLVEVVALAHHKNDQAETILLNILRGSGLDGACGMKPKNSNYIRPFLAISKVEILAYIEKNNLRFVQDETNFESDYARNYLRNEIFTRLDKKFGNVEESLCKFSQNCLEDANFINSTIDFSCVKYENNVVKIPQKIMQKYHKSQNFRLIKHCLCLLNEEKDFSKPKFENIMNLLSSKSGSRISLKENLSVFLDYDYLTIEKKENEIEKKIISKEFAKKDLIDLNFGEYQFKIFNNLNLCSGAKHILDFAKLPNLVQIRTRLNGDVFAKFGSGTRKLKDYFINQKIPQRKRDDLLLLASKNEILCVFDCEISDKVKYDNNTTQFLAIFKKENNIK